MHYDPSEIIPPEMMNLWTYDELNHSSVLNCSVLTQYLLSKIATVLSKSSSLKRPDG